MLKSLPSSASPEEVIAATDAFRSLVNKNQVTGDDKNIDTWGKRGWSEFKTFVDTKSQQKTQKQIKSAAVEGNSITLKETDDWIFSLPLDKDSSCFIGKDTHWCTARPHALDFESKFYEKNNHLIYIIQKSNPDAKWAIEVSEAGTVQGAYDKDDNRITMRELSGETGVDRELLVKVVNDSVSDENLKIINSYRKNHRRALKNAEKLINSISGSRSEALEQNIVTVNYPHLYKDYMGRVGRSEYPVPFQKRAVRSDPNLIKLISNPSDSVVNYVLSKDISFFSEIVNPSRDIIKSFIDKVKPSDMIYIFDEYVFPPTMQMALVNRDLSFAKTLPTLHPIVFDEVLARDAFALAGRRNLTPQEKEKLQNYLDSQQSIDDDDLDDFVKTMKK